MECFNLNEKDCQMTLIPSFRASSGIRPEVRIHCPQAQKVSVYGIKNEEVCNVLESIPLLEGTNKIDLDLMGMTGDIRLQFKFYNVYGEIICTKEFPYQVMNVEVKSTTLIDGCWISIYHWSEGEARWFNGDLKKLTDEDWKKQIYSMNEVGIKGIIIQNVFHCDEYAGKHSMSVKDYKGLALYPSGLFGERYPIAARDPVEAILSAADECEMSVFMGVGSFAWFDFSPEALEWHKNVTNELFELYGTHKSLYGWYVSAEIFGALYYDYPHVENEKYKEIVTFFQEYKAFVDKLTPTKPIAFAPNNIRFQEFEKEWKEILPNVDILLPFAFARDPENLNIKEIADICEACCTHFWVDMEMFAWPIDNGLLPKSIEELIGEIRFYDDVEQIYGYQFTGIMNPPDNQYNLGGERAKELYKRYMEYYKCIGERNNGGGIL